MSALFRTRANKTTAHDAFTHFFDTGRAAARHSKDYPLITRNGARIESTNEYFDKNTIMFNKWNDVQWTAQNDTPICLSLCLAKYEHHRAEELSPRRQPEHGVSRCRLSKRPFSVTITTLWPNVKGQAGIFTNIGAWTVLVAKGTHSHALPSSKHLTKYRQGQKGQSRPPSQTQATSAPPRTTTGGGGFTSRSTARKTDAGTTQRPGKHPVPS